MRQIIGKLRMRLRINLQRILLTSHLAVRTRDNKLASSMVEFMEQFWGEDEYVTYTDPLLLRFNNICSAVVQ
jgi:hypothetical protein